MNEIVAQCGLTVCVALWVLAIQTGEPLQPAGCSVDPLSCRDLRNPSSSGSRLPEAYKPLLAAV
jgi:hypothetical protein